MNVTNYLYQLTLILLILVLGFLAARLIWVALRRWRPKPQKAPRKRDLLLDTLREQTLREREAAAARQAASLAYESLDALHHTIMSQLPIGVLVVDRQGRIGYANPGATRVLRRDHLDQLSLSTLDAALASAFERARDQGDQTEQLISAEHGEGLRHLSLRVKHLGHENHLLILEDRTAVLEMEERLRYKRELELMGEMASGIAHEVKNSLAVIQGRIQLLDHGEDPTHRDAVMAEIDHLLRVVRQFMKSSKGLTLDLDTLSLETWLTANASRWRQRPDSDAVRFIPLAEGDAQLVVDPNLLSLVLDNLITNGLEATHDRDEPIRVTVSAEVLPQQVRLVVADSGPGFSKEVRGRLFVPFVSSKKNGTGLGLYHCRKIMMEHDGRLELLPDPPTRMCCTLPRPKPTLSESH